MLRMDMSPTRSLTSGRPPQHERRPSFTEPSTPAQYYSDFELADMDEYDAVEEDFSFVFEVPRQSRSPDVTADELFSQGRILPLYPAFSKFGADKLARDELDMFETASTSHPEPSSSPLNDDRCEWAPKSAPTSPCRKSRSTGSARKWIFHEFLAGGRSQSDGKEKFVFLEKPSRSKDKAPVQAKEKPPGKSTKADNHQKKKKKETDLATAYKSLYGLKKEKGKLKEGEKRKSFLPYFGFFGGGLNAFTKTSYPY